MFLIIQRALSRELLHTGLACALVLALVFLAVRSLSFMSQVVAGVLPVESLPLLLLLKLATYADLLLPLVMYITVLLVLGRWRRDNELAALAAGGNGLALLGAPLGGLMLVAVALTLAFSLFLGPAAVRWIDAIGVAHKQRLTVDNIVPGVFARGRDGRSMYFVESRDVPGGEFRNVFIHDPWTGGEGVVTADRAVPHTDHRSGQRWLVLHDGIRYEGGGAGAPYRVMRFSRYTLRIPEREAGATAQPAPRAMVMAQLYAARAQGGGTAAGAEWHWRLSKVIMLPALLLLAVAFGSAPQGRHGGRGRRGSVVLVAFLAYFAYSNLAGYTIGLARNGLAAAPWAIYLLHAAFLVAAVHLCRCRDRNLPLRLWPGR